MLLETTYYRAVTGDTTTPDNAVATAASAAQDLLVDALGRGIEEAERTESCLLYPDGTCYPSVTPITAVDGDLVHYHDTVYGAPATVEAFVGLIDTSPPARATIVYTGGWTTATCPECILRDLAWVTYTILNPAAVRGLAQTPGAQAVKVGDVAVTYGATSGVPAAGEIGVVWSRATLRHRAVTP